MADGFDRLSSLPSFARAERRDFGRFELMLTAFTASVWKEGECSVRAGALAMQCATLGGCESDPAFLKGGCGSATAIAGGGFVGCLFGTSGRLPSVVGKRMWAYLTASEVEGKATQIVDHCMYTECLFFLL